MCIRDRDTIQKASFSITSIHTAINIDHTWQLHELKTLKVGVRRAGVGPLVGCHATTVVVCSAIAITLAPSSVSGDVVGSAHLALLVWLARVAGLDSGHWWLWHCFSHCSLRRCHISQDWDTSLLSSHSHVAFADYICILCSDSYKQLLWMAISACISCDLVTRWVALNTVHAIRPPKLGHHGMYSARK